MIILCYRSTLLIRDMNQLLNDYKLLFIYNQYNVMKCMSTVGCKIPRLAVCTSVCVYVCVCVL